MENALSVKPAKFQGVDEITINASLERLWQLISDSTMPEKWGPPVREVTVMNLPGKLGSRRIVVGEFTPNGAVITAEESPKAKKKKLRISTNDESSISKGARWVVALKRKTSVFSM